MRARASSPLRIVYAAGPGDVIGTYRKWKTGHDDDTQVAITYSGQFYSLCQELGAEGYVVAWCPSKEIVRDGLFIIEHRPVPFRGAAGLAYHLGQVLYGLGLAATCLRFRAHMLVVSSGTHWFVLNLLPLLGVRVVPTLHCVLWRKHRPLGRVQRFVRWLDSILFSWGAAGIMSISAECSRQVEFVTSGKHPPVAAFLPTFRTESFIWIGSPSEPRRPFRVLFAGRIERNKGVFDVLAIARRLRELGRVDIEFDMCGTGSALESLRREASNFGVEALFRCHGYCNRDSMRRMYEQCHAVIVPTTSDFVEGFNKVVAEGILAGRPVITSSVCPALEYTGPAVIEVAPDDADGYLRAILQLADEPQLYDAKRSGCAAVQAQFYDRERGWGAALRRVIVSLNLARPAESTACAS